MDRFPEVWQVYDRIITGQNERRVENPIVTKSGELRHIIWQNNVVREHGEIVSTISFGIDITDRKRAEEALRQSEEQLRQSQKMEAVGQLAGGIAHDFNNLLTAIMGYSDLLLLDEAVQAPHLRRDVGEIKRAAERAAALTRQILAFSRRQALQPVLVSLNQTILGMEELLRRTLGEDIELVTLLQPHLGLTEVDVNQFEQVLMNLAVNARDAMPIGGRLTLETANVVLRQEILPHAPRRRTGFLRESLRLRHRPGHERGDRVPHLRALLHHQGSGRRHRPGALDRLRHPPAERREHRSPESAR